MTLEELRRWTELREMKQDATWKLKTEFQL